MEEKFKNLVENSHRILITSHIGPDGDSVCSALLLYEILSSEYPGIKITLNMEERPIGLDFLSVGKIHIGSLAEAIESSRPDLFIILDANTVDRLSRQPDQARTALKNSSAKVAIIDHHEPEGVEPNDLYINNMSPAVTLDVYEIFIKNLKFKKPPGYAQTALTGIYTDTGGFINRNLNFEKTFEAVPELLKDGADLEVISNQLKKISEDGAKVFLELMQNMAFGNGYTYSFISDEIASDNGKLEAIRQAADMFRSEILRNIEGRTWGFIVYRDVLAADSIYSVSFRAISGTKDVSELAIKLGGGGHKPAAGAKFKAADVYDAVEKIKAAIEAA